MKYLSVCSGIEAATVAWHPLGWKPLAFSEIEPFPRAVLAHHYPNVPLHGDFTALRDQSWIVDADVLVGGTPCQAFSVAGLRQSLSDDRGNLSLEFVRLADAIDNLRLSAGREPAVIVWENVPGVLTVKDNAFGCFLAGLAGDVAPYVPPRGKWTNAGVVAGPERTVAWRVLDAQYFGLAQRRKRVFVVASSRDGFDPSAVLFEREGVRRDTAPRREARETAPTIPSRSTGGGGLGTDFDCDGGLIPETAACLTAGSGQRYDSETDTMLAVAGPICRDTYNGGMGGKVDMVAQGYAVPISFGAQMSTPQTDIDMVQTLQAKNPMAVAFSAKDHGADAQNEIAPTMRSMGHAKSHANGGGQLAVATSMAVRRLTPRECERLQGFPDDYTLVPVRKKLAADGPRYKALGNSMAVPVMAWIGGRIASHITVHMDNGPKGQSSARQSGEWNGRQPASGELYGHQRQDAVQEAFAISPRREIDRPSQGVAVSKNDSPISLQRSHKFVSAFGIAHRITVFFAALIDEVDVQTFGLAFCNKVTGALSKVRGKRREDVRHGVLRSDEYKLGPLVLYVNKGF